jgi:RimJ/RimL family protein N-acetyltransferase
VARRAESKLAQPSDRLVTGLRTPRLPWQEADLEPFAAMNADLRVMAYYPSVLTRQESDRFVRERILPQFELSGYGLWAVEAPGVTSFAGYVGLLEHTFDAPFAPCVEVGWRLAFRYWGHGYATERPRAALTYGFDAGGLDRLSCSPPSRTREVCRCGAHGWELVSVLLE